MKNIFILLLCCFSFLYSMAQPGGCLPVIEGAKLEVTPADLTGTGSPTPAVGGPRVLFWLHGLGGMNDFWNPVATHYDNEKEVFTVKPTFGSTGIEDAAVDLHGQIADTGSTYIMENDIDRSKNILIAQSMGGLVGRALDRRYVQVYGEDERRFGGLISFCGPHQGARINNNADLDGPAMINEFAERGAAALAKGPITEAIDNIENQIESKLSGLIPPFAKVLGFALGPTVGGGLLWLDSKLDGIDLNNSGALVDPLQAIVGAGIDFLFPILFDSFTSNNAADHAVGAPFLTELNQFDTNIPMVAVYSEEIDPIFWRVISSFTIDTPKIFLLFRQLMNHGWIMRII